MFLDFHSTFKQSFKKSKGQYIHMLYYIEIIKISKKRNFLDPHGIGFPIYPSPLSLNKIIIYKYWYQKIVTLTSMSLEV